MLRQTIEAAVAAKSNFAENLANIAHQLKTPITSAFLSLQLMKKETANEYVTSMEKQLKRLNRLEESLLTLSRIDSGTLPFKQEQVDLYTALNLAAENLSDLLRKKHISVEIPENGCIEFSGDLEWTMEALIDLMKNCMEHSQSGGIVHCGYSEILFMSGFGYGTMEQALTRRTYHTFSTGFIGAGALWEMESESDWRLPALSLNCKTERLPPIICETAARVLK